MKIKASIFLDYKAVSDFLATNSMLDGFAMLPGVGCCCCFACCCSAAITN